MKISDKSVESKIFSLDKMETFVSSIKNKNKTISLCHGVFDLLHPGHIQHFKEASELSDYLFVSVTSDKYVNKGPGRPLFPEKVRIESLAALENIDGVLISDYPNAIQVLRCIKPDFYVKGPDYAKIKNDTKGMLVKEKEAVEAYGGKIYFSKGLTSSSSMLINNYYSNVDKGTQDWINSFKEAGGYESVLDSIAKIANLKTVILGETIIDQYTYCNSLAKSSKDPILAFQLVDTSYYPGGILSIANICSDLTSETSLISCVAPNDPNLKVVKDKINSKIQQNLVLTNDRPTILKHRYVDTHSNTKVFEYYDFVDSPLSSDTNTQLIEYIIKLIKNTDLIIAADYGHGFFSNTLISYIQQLPVFLAVNTQANAGNRGYNTISKYPRADLITFNGAELELELRDRNPDYFSIVPKIIKQKNSQNAIVTLGAGGLIVFDNDGNHEKVPAFANKVVDKVGAGDAVFSIASLLAKVNAPLKVIGFLANLVAAHEVSQLGHQKSLTSSDLLKHVKAILG